MHHPICFNWKARNEIITETAATTTTKSSVVCESLALPHVKLTCRTVLMIQKQWLVTHYFFSVFKKKRIIFFYYTWDILFGSNIHTYWSINKLLYRRQRRQQRHNDDSHYDNSTSVSIIKQTIHFSLRFLLHCILVWQMIARFIFCQFNTNRIFTYTTHLICCFLFF